MSLPSFNACISNSINLAQETAKTDFYLIHCQLKHSLDLSTEKFVWFGFKNLICCKVRVKGTIYYIVKSDFFKEEIMMALSARKQQVSDDILSRGISFSG